jgi:hypothetical protein
MAETIVHGFEVVQVQEEDGDRFAVATASSQSVLESIAEERAVREACESVVGGLVRELRFETLPLRDIAIVAHDAHHVRVVQYIRCG